MMVYSEHKAMSRSKTTELVLNIQAQTRPINLDGGMKATIEVRGGSELDMMVERYNIIRTHAMYRGHCTSG